ncbi:endolytic transglycosylase MltG [Hoyosella sp. YIM 151337]|uniref:endolytic transglycosylase MltG n=1 Tax=Hoyosella sp. YIM 151337 TaxID=2992742 RepID=UPI00223663D9|nr:endolytic transglycosylase MltG [Hoyosella sp. YIM 151337]MCW4353227.1 endolytic transglycosylase MltG [Hoyosella sp. YIM 151337]
MNDYRGHEPVGAKGGSAGSAPEDWDTADYGLERAEPEWVGAEGSGTPQHVRRRRELERNRRRRRNMLVFGLIVVLLLAGVVYIGAMILDGRRPAPVPDYTGSGVSDIVVRVQPGDSGSDIAATLLERDVIMSTSAFMTAAHGRDDIAAIQPGYYKVRTQIPAATAVDMLTDGDNRVGSFVIPEGRKLHSSTAVTGGHVTAGIYAMIARASCVELDGTETCLTEDELRSAAANADLDSLGVPDWARAEVARAEDPERRIEGLIRAGQWDVDPDASAVEILAELITRSARAYEQTGILEASQTVGVSPYEMLTIASLLEHEALPGDFSKVARVILNRLDAGMRLEFDSTVNYALDEIEIATTDAARQERTPWNTYAMEGLPQTPVSSPSIEALQAVENPEDGDWRFFVTIDFDGTTVFTDTFDEHLRNVQIAIRNGVLASGR